jgi:hypothetical protein
MKEINDLNNHTKTFIIVMLLFAICASYYLYKNFQNINNELKTILVLIIFVSIYFSYYNYQENRSFNALKNNYALSKGKITNYFISNKVSLRGGSGSNDVKYIYSVNNKEFENKYSERGYIDIPDIKPDLNIEYMVLYQKDNPKNSVMLLNYPLRRQGDFEKYEKIFAEGIPKDVFRGY